MAEELRMEVVPAEGDGFASPVEGADETISITRLLSQGESERIGYCWRIRDIWYADKRPTTQPRVKAQHGSEAATKLIEMQPPLIA
jgi:hypothetical protein